MAPRHRCVEGLGDVRRPLQDHLLERREEKKKEKKREKGLRSVTNFSVSRGDSNSVLVECFFFGFS